MNHRVTIKTKKTLAILIFAFTLLSAGKAATYYAINSGDWENEKIWKSASLNQSYPQEKDTVYILNEITVTISSSTSCQDLIIGEGISGNILFTNSKSIRLAIRGNLIINQGAKLEYNSNSSKIHNLTIEGNVINQGIVKLRVDADDLVTITCNGLSDTYIDGEGEWQVAGLIINKEQKNNKVEIRSTNFANALTTAANFLSSPSISLLKGTFIQNNIGSIDCIVDPINGKVVNYTIPSDVRIEIKKGTLLFSTLANVILEGDLIIRGGEIKIAPYAVFPNGNLLYSSSKKTTPKIELYKQGNLTITGRLMNKNISASDKINILIHGGSLVLGKESNMKLKNHFYLTPNSLCEFIEGKIIIYHSFSNSAILNKINLNMNKNFIFYKNEILLTNFFT